MLNKYNRLYHTVKYLKLKQIYFRIYYLLRRKYRVLTKFEYKEVELSHGVNQLLLLPSIPSYSSYLDSEFTFLNLSVKFDKRIDWNYLTHGKLWCYNLNYFEFLNQENIEKSVALELIESYLESDISLLDGKEPFPLSLRGINWIKFMTYQKISNKRIEQRLFNHYQLLLNQLEYHLLGNHLLENGFSLLFGAYYFKDNKLYNKAKEILYAELEEEILEDGGHYELSTMYHQLMLFRLLDCINLVMNNDFKGKELEGFLRGKASLMLSWLDQMTYKNGTVPLVNDSAPNIAPTSNQLFHYAQELNISVQKKELSSSGYRRITFEKYEACIDIGNIGPDYILGHAHADTFNFEVQIDEQPFIIDGGLSTYENNDRRTLERGTSFHNTVEINNMNSSHVWGGFRVAQRAKIIEIKEEKYVFSAIHNGYVNKLNIQHERKWRFSEKSIVIDDSLNKASKAIARLHFHPNVKKEMILNHIKIIHGESKLSYYHCGMGFNRVEKAYVLEIAFKKELSIEIIMKEGI